MRSILKRRLARPIWHSFSCKNYGRNWNVVQGNASSSVFLMLDTFFGKKRTFFLLSRGKANRQFIVSNNNGIVNRKRGEFLLKRVEQPNYFAFLSSYSEFRMDGLLCGVLRMEPFHTEPGIVLRWRHCLSLCTLHESALYSRSRFGVGLAGSISYRLGEMSPLSLLSVSRDSCFSLCCGDGFTCVPRVAALSCYRSCRAAATRGLRHKKTTWSSPSACSLLIIWEMNWHGLVQKSTDATGDCLSA